MNLLQMSFAASLMIIVTVIIRALTINKIPKKTFLALWGIVAVRLLVPFRLTSPFSAYTFLEKHTDFANTPLNIVIPLAENKGIENISVVSQTSIIINVVFWIWLVGMIIGLLFFGISYIRCLREFQMSLPITSEYVENWLQNQQMHRSISVRQSSQISTPLTYGIFYPVILLPKNTDWENTNQLQYILTHEYFHIRQFDIIKKILLVISLCTHWFNPFVWVMYILANRDIELVCDDMVVRQMGQNTKKSYACALISLEATRSGVTPFCSNFSKNAIEERIEAIMKINKITSFTVAFAIFLVVAVTTVFATNAASTIIDDDAFRALSKDEREQYERELNNQNVGSGNEVMSRLDVDSGETIYSLDSGTTWINSSDYLRMHPDDNETMNYWTEDEFISYMAQQKQGWKELVASGELSQKDYDASIAVNKAILSDIQNGMLVSKSLGNNSLICNPADILQGTGDHEYSISIKLDNGEIKEFEAYSTVADLYADVTPYCEEQLKTGNMTQKEFDEIMGIFK